VRILLTAISDEAGEAPEMDTLAQVLSDIGHQVDIFIAPENTTIRDEVGYSELKKQLKRTLDLIKPDVIECSDVDAVAYALGDLGYAYIVNMADRVTSFELTPEDDTQSEIIRKAGFIFTETENQKKNLMAMLHIDEKKLVTMPISEDGHMVAERLAYYQQMLVRHSLH